MKTIIRAPRLFDGIQTTLSDGAVLILENERILYAGSVADAPDMQGKEFSFTNGTILPGLIDAHVHLTMDGSDDPVSKTQTDSTATATLRAVVNAEKQLHAGVTTVRDCGCQGNIAVDLSRAVDTSLLEMSPRIIACGPVVCITGGHGAFVGVEADGPDEVRKAVRGIIKNGAAFIKVITTGGVLTKGSSAVATQMGFDELKAVVEEAKNAGLRTTTHAHATKGIKWALKAGFDSIDHATYIDEEIIALFKETKAFYIPTLVASICQMEHLDNIPDFVAEKIQRHIDLEYDSVDRLIAAGIPLAGATDAGTPFNSHGNLPRQLLLLNEHGLSPIQTLAAGTSGSAAAIGILDETGSLDAGKFADILVVEGNPTTNLEDLKNVKGVWRQGKQLI